MTEGRQFRLSQMKNKIWKIFIKDEYENKNKNLGEK